MRGKKSAPKPAPVIIALNHATGSICIEKEKNSAECIGCQRKGGEMVLVEIQSINTDGEAPPFHMCGHCISVGIFAVIVGKKREADGQD